MGTYKKLFLEKSILGRKTNLDNPDEVILKCIKLAYNDMLRAGRYYVSNDMDLRCKKVNRILEESHYTYSRKIIEKSLKIFGDEEKIGTGNRYVTRYGLAQKLVNMTYKYLYVFYDYIPNTHIDFSKCDCPLDSVILEKLQFEGHAWSKITRTEYEHCQQMITDGLKEEKLDEELISLGNLAYDFLKW